NADRHVGQGAAQSLCGPVMRRAATFIGSLSITLAVQVFTPISRAQPSSGNHPLVKLGIGSCVGVPVEEVRKIVGVELGALLVAEGETPTADVTVIDVQCGPAIELRVDDPITGKSLTREIDLSKEAASARPRLLAL